jgi:hypothetical protein
MEDYKQKQLKLIDLNWDGDVNTQEYPTFKSFTSRMWLDHVDETNDHLATTYTFEEYVLQYHDWLKKQYILKNGIV